MSSKSQNPRDRERKVKKGRWAEKDDQLLHQLVQMESEPKRPKWTNIAKKFGSRSGKQCRERWENHLKLGIVKRRFSDEESRFIHQEVERYQPEHPKWAAISAQLPACTPLMVRNHVNNFRRKRASSDIKKSKPKNKKNVPVKPLRPKPQEENSSMNIMSIGFLLNPAK